MSTAQAAEGVRSSGDPTPLERTLRGQMPVLDGLRGVAILLVLAHRFGVDEHPVSPVARAVAAILEFGWVGVQLFFVLSGFLITGILLDSRRNDGYFRTFFARRVLRIFPLYYTVLVVAFVILPLAGHPLDGREHQVWLWTYLSNWADPLGLGVAAFPHFWSLAVEEQFYLVWPFVVRALSPRGMAAVCAAAIVAALGARIALRAWGGSTAMPYQLTVCRMDALAMGAAAAWALRVPELARAIARRQRELVISAALLLLAGDFATHHYPRDGVMTQTLGYSLLSWAFVVALVAAVLAQARGSRLAGALAPAPLRTIGKYSYAMYIFHVPLHHQLGLPLLARWAPHPGVVESLAYTLAMTALTFVAAFASYHLLEKHFLRLKRRFSPRAAS